MNSSAELVPETGSATELAILKFMKKAGVSYQEYRLKYSSVDIYPFSSTRKRMSVIINSNEGQ